VPGVLSGVWRMTFQGADQKLSLEHTTYQVYVVVTDAATGTVSVQGNDITFADSSTCSGQGTYSWKITHGALRFTPVGSDPCPRAGLLPIGAWTRVHH
jgi:hypothetical protein